MRDSSLRLIFFLVDRLFFGFLATTIWCKLHAMTDDVTCTAKKVVQTRVVCDAILSDEALTHVKTKPQTNSGKPKASVVIAKASTYLGERLLGDTPSERTTRAGR